MAGTPWCFQKVKMNNKKPAIDNGNNGIETILESLMEMGLEGFGECCAALLNLAMKMEREKALLAKPYERTEGRLGYANGFKSKQLKTRIGELSLQIPQVRDSSFYPKCLEKGQRSERALLLSIAEMYISGTSTRKVKHAFEELCGLEVTSMDVSRATKILDEEFEKWRNRPIGQIRYLMIDARYEKVRINHRVQDVAVLIAMGVDEKGHRRLLGVSVATSESEVHWRNFLQSLQERGMTGLEMITSDDHSGLRAARRSVFPSVPWQRCQFHLMQNALSYLGKDTEEPIKELRDIFAARNDTQATERLNALEKKYENSNPRFSHWAKENVPECFTVYQVLESHRRRLRTTNGLERINREIKRRTKVASIFPNTDSLLRLVTGILIEIDESWMTGRLYLETGEQH